jgi:hypothetical protein
MTARSSRPDREDFAPLAREPLAPCGVAPSDKGTIRVKVEAQMTLPDDFDRRGQKYRRIEYSLVLAPASTH